MSPDLRTHYLGLELRTPLVASAGPLTGEVDSLTRLEDAGIAAVVLPSLFEEQIVHESLELHHVLEHGTESFGEAASFFPDLEDYGTGPDRYLRSVERARERLSVPVMASLNADSAGSWVRYAALVESAGASAIELNVYAIGADPTRPSSELEAEHLDLVAEVRAAIDVPLAVKLSPFFSSLSHFAVEVAGAGADGLVLFNRFYQPDLDLETLEVAPRLELSQPWEIRLPLRWIAMLRPVLDISLAASTGIGDSDAVVKALLVGADVTMMTSALLREGPDLVSEIERGLVTWLEANDYDSVAQLKGSVSHEGAEDPAAFERANYMKTLASWGRRNR